MFFIKGGQISYSIDDKYSLEYVRRLDIGEKIGKVVCHWCQTQRVVVLYYPTQNKHR